MERVWVEVIVVKTIQNTDVTPRSLQTFPRNELTLSSGLKIALNIELLRSFETSANFYKTIRCKISEDIFRTNWAFESRLLRIKFGVRDRVLGVSEFIFLG